MLEQGLQREVFLRDVLDGLSRWPKTLPCKYLYDERGSRLFDDICELDEYYPTRTELAIMGRHVSAMVEQIGPRALVIEPGAGSGLKTRLLLERLERPVAFVPVEISGEYLRGVAERLAACFPRIEILPVCADFTGEFALPEPRETPRCNVIYFPGSTIGNFTPAQRRRLLDRFAQLTGADGGVLLGFDLRKDVTVLEAAYNDSAGVTRDFNLNLLRRINRELAGDFDIAAFRHEAVWNDALSRIEMHLVSRRRQEAHIAGRRVRFDAGESIHTESSHKFTVEQIESDAGRAGLALRRLWTDEKRYFAVAWLEPA